MKTILLKATNGNFDIQVGSLVFYTHDEDINRLRICQITRLYNKDKLECLENNKITDYGIRWDRFKIIKII